jgi:glycosyltransferase involved in cell wall biosynthesis
VLDSQEFRCSLAASGLDRARAFSWDRTARSALAAFEHLHATRGAHDGAEAARAVPRAIEAVASCCSKGSPPADLAEISRAIARIPPADARPRLFVDISELSQRDARTGIQRVTRSVLDVLLDQPPAGFDVQPVYGTLDTCGYRYASAFLADRAGTAAGPEADLPIDFSAGDVFLGLDLQHDVVCAQQPYLEELRRHGVLVTFVVYDLLPIALPGAFPPGADSGHRTWLDVISRFDGAVCISAAVASELDAWLRINPAPRLRPFPIRSFRLGSSFSGAAATAATGSGAGAENAARTLEALAARTSFLTVGTVEPRKGHEQILLAFELLWQRGLQLNLVIVGKQGWMVSALCDRLHAHPERNRRLFWLEGISDNYLERLYDASSCLIAASLGEGFGLPLIEAAHHRLPIIARDIPVFREVAGEHACYFHGNDPAQLAEQISAWLELYRAGRHPASTGMKLLSWKQSTEELLRIVLDMRDGAHERTLTENGTRVLP